MEGSEDDSHKGRGTWERVCEWECREHCRWEGQL